MIPPGALNSRGTAKSSMPSGVNRWKVIVGVVCSGLGWWASDVAGAQRGVTKGGIDAGVGLVASLGTSIFGWLNGLYATRLGRRVLIFVTG